MATIASPRFSSSQRQILLSLIDRIENECGNVGSGCHKTASAQSSFSNSSDLLTASTSKTILGSQSSSASLRGFETRRSQTGSQCQLPDSNCGQLPGARVPDTTHLTPASGEPAPDWLSYASNLSSIVASVSTVQAMDTAAAAAAAAAPWQPPLHSTDSCPVGGSSSAPICGLQQPKTFVRAKRRKARVKKDRDKQLDPQEAWKRDLFSQFLCYGLSEEDQRENLRCLLRATKNRSFSIRCDQRKKFTDLKLAAKCRDAPVRVNRTTQLRMQQVDDAKHFENNRAAVLNRSLSTNWRRQNRKQLRKKKLEEEKNKQQEWRPWQHCQPVQRSLNALITQTNSQSTLSSPSLSIDNYGESFIRKATRRRRGERNASCESDVSLTSLTIMLDDIRAQNSAVGTQQRRQKKSHSNSVSTKTTSTRPSALTTTIKTTQTDGTSSSSVPTPSIMQEATFDVSSSDIHSARSTNGSLKKMLSKVDRQPSTASHTRTSSIGTSSLNVLTRSAQCAAMEKSRRERRPSVSAIPIPMIRAIKQALSKCNQQPSKITVRGRAQSVDVGIPGKNATKVPVVDTGLNLCLPARLPSQTEVEAPMQQQQRQQTLPQHVKHLNQEDQPVPKPAPRRHLPVGKRGIAPDFEYLEKRLEDWHIQSSNQGTGMMYSSPESNETMNHLRKKFLSGVDKCLFGTSLNASRGENEPMSPSTNSAGCRFYWEFKSLKIDLGELLEMKKNILTSDISPKTQAEFLAENQRRLSVKVRQLDSLIQRVWGHLEELHIGSDNLRDEMVAISQLISSQDVSDARDAMASEAEMVADVMGDVHQKFTDMIRLDKLSNVEILSPKQPSSENTHLESGNNATAIVEPEGPICLKCSSPMYRTNQGITPVSTSVSTKASSCNCIRQSHDRFDLKLENCNYCNLKTTDADPTEHAMRIVGQLRHQLEMMRTISTKSRIKNLGDPLTTLESRRRESRQEAIVKDPKEARLTPIYLRYRKWPPGSPEFEAFAANEYNWSKRYLHSILPLWTRVIRVDLSLDDPISLSLVCLSSRLGKELTPDWVLSANGFPDDSSLDGTNPCKSKIIPPILTPKQAGIMPWETLFMSESKFTQRLSQPSITQFFQTTEISVSPAATVVAPVAESSPRLGSPTLTTEQAGIMPSKTVFKGESKYTQRLSQPSIAQAKLSQATEVSAPPAATVVAPVAESSDISTMIASPTFLPPVAVSPLSQDARTMTMAARQMIRVSERVGTTAAALSSDSGILPCVNSEEQQRAARQDEATPEVSYCSLCHFTTSVNGEIYGCVREDNGQSLSDDFNDRRDFSGQLSSMDAGDCIEIGHQVPARLSCSFKCRDGTYAALKDRRQHGSIYSSGEASLDPSVV